MRQFASSSYTFNIWMYTSSCLMRAHWLDCSLGTDQFELPFITRLNFPSRLYMSCVHHDLHHIRMQVAKLPGSERKALLYSPSSYWGRKSPSGIEPSYLNASRGVECNLFSLVSIIIPYWNNRERPCLTPGAPLVDETSFFDPFPYSYLNPFVIMASGRSDDSTSLLLI